MAESSPARHLWRRHDENWPRKPDSIRLQCLIGLCRSTVMFSGTASGTSGRSTSSLRFADEQPSLVRTGLLPDEQVNLDTYAWIEWSDLSSLPDPVEPPRLPAVLGALPPDGSWRDRGRS